MSETEGTESVIDIDDLDAFSADLFGQKKAEPEKTKPEAEQEKVVETAEDTEAQTDEEDEAELNEPIKEAPKKKKTVQDRINEVVAQREELKRESERQLTELRAEVEKLKNPVVVQPANGPVEPTPDAVDKDGNPIYTLGEFDPQYIRDLTKFTLDQERTRFQDENAQAKKVAEQHQEQQQLQTSWNGKLDEATKEYPDLIEKGQALLNNFNNLPMDYSNYLSTVLMQMDKGPDVLYYLSNHPDEARQIVNSGAQKATLALGRIEAKFLDADAEKQLAKPKISKAPTPPAERARGTNGAFISVSGDTEDLDEFTREFFKKK